MLSIHIPQFHYQEHNVIRQFNCLSLDNEYIPIVCLRGASFYSLKDKKILTYKLEVDTNALGIRNFRMTCDSLKGLSSREAWMSPTHSSITKKYYGASGTIINFDPTTETLIPLMMLCLKREFLFTVNRANPDPSNFCLLVDRSFMTDSEHFKLYRNINKGYITTIEKEIDILYTNDIKRLCFNAKSVVLPKFKTIEAMKEHYRELNKILVANL